MEHVRCAASRLVACPIFYERIFLPCWNCFDFEATMAHEIGHVLGFSHPDTLSLLNLKVSPSPRP
jgi:hypothetical protein